MLRAERRLRDAEVGDAHDAVDADEDVLGGDVAVDEVERDAVVTRALVRRVEALQGVDGDGGDDVERKAGAGGRGRAEQLREVDALHPLHYDRGRARGPVDDAERADDVRVTNGRAEEHLVLERGEAVRVVGEEGVELLDRDVTAAEARQIHRRRSAHTEGADDLETARPVRPSERIFGSHRSVDTSTAVPSRENTRVLLSVSPVLST
ncbi:MAG: hypothetical protein JST00_07415 [Deltaproteobacteria bacterium]|nr:hypothetical protein [Deltaproteobacteria bacterium]